MLSRSGYVIPLTKKDQVKSDLTVRPLASEGYPQPPSFQVYRIGKSLCVPRFYGVQKFGEPDQDTRPEPSKASIKFVGKLKDETCQNEALKKALEAGHGVLSLPCGYGKTTVALALSAKLGYRTMIIVHKEFLAHQWRERIEQFCPGSTIGRIQRDTCDVQHDFVIAMLQSLTLKEYKFDAFESFGTVIVDEAHHICAQVFSQALFKICPRHLYGLSATPDRKDGLTKVLNWFMGPTFFSVARKDQTQVEVFTIEFDHSGPLPLNRCGKVSLVNMITELVENDDRNKLLIKTIKKIGKNRKVLVLSDRRNHCETLHSHFKDLGGLYMGGMSRDALEETSKKQIIFGTFSQAHEGLDIPTLDTVVLATPKSDIQQSIGRILRETPGKQNNPHIYDIKDNWNYILTSMYKKRLGVYRSGQFTIHGYEEEVPVIPKGVILFMKTE